MKNTSLFVVLAISLISIVISTNESFAQSAPNAFISNVILTPDQTVEATVILTPVITPPSVVSDGKGMEFPTPTANSAGQSPFRQVPQGTYDISILPPDGFTLGKATCEFQENDGSMKPIGTYDEKSMMVMGVGLTSGVAHVCTWMFEHVVVPAISSIQVIEQPIAEISEKIPIANAEPSLPSNWFDSNWQNRKHITVDSNQVNSDLTDFPLLVRVTDIDLKNKALSNGNDILFTAADGITKLSHEIEKYDGATGDLVAWVKIPIVSGATDTSVFMYYGNAAATNQQYITGTWNSNYEVVSHLSDDYLDSTINNNHGTNSGTVQSAGIIGGASSFNGISNYVQLANEANFDFERTNTSTLSAWFISNDGTGCGELIGKMGASPYNGYDMIICNGQVYSELINSWPSNVLRERTNSAAFGDGSWHYGVITYDGSSSPTGLKTYIDGIEQTTTTTHNTLSKSILQNIAVRYGERSNGDAPLAGELDEARVSAAVHSADWINAEFNNQKMSSNFIALGTEEASVQSPQ